PIRFLFPVYRGARVPGWQIDLGLWMYGRMTGGRQKHQRLGPDEVERLAPGIVRDGLDTTFAYGDARADDARLTLAVAATGFAYGGLLLTRAQVEEPVRDAGGRLRGLRVRDLETGEVHGVEARLVINATGVWVDEVRHRLGLEGRRVRPSRGSHLILSRDRLPLTAALTVPSPDDGRPVFFIPHPEGVLVGTTDLFHEEGLDDPRPTRQEVDYLLRTLQAVFPGRGITAGDVLGAFAGVRPIVDTAADTPSAASREEAIWEEQGLLSIAGGKLTTWRAMAEEVVDRALTLLPAGRAAAAAPCATAGTPVGALAPPDLVRRLRSVHGLAPDVASGMARRLGSLAWTACQEAGAAGDLRPLVDGADLTAAEARAHLRFGAVTRLEDLLLRRARFGMWAPAMARELVPRLAPLIRRELGWDLARWEQETETAAAALTAWSPEGVREAS
ncbi:MAG TPA: glycerol-3-phosphate dehydrogenase/oxidase, partial [Thermoanaerobaculia bacterium]|nr:glycerol-3-phosphate dehydrogenase/oxidase [Thermoanaerobaculia bacterium]